MKIKFTVQDPCQIVRKSFGDPIAEDLRCVVKTVGEVTPAITRPTNHARHIRNLEDRNMKTLLMVSSLITALITATGAGAESDDRGWQLKKLFSPTSQDLARQPAGQVFIFDGLRDTDVEQAMQSEL